MEKRISSGGGLDQGDDVPLHGRSLQELVVQDEGLDLFSILLDGPGGHGYRRADALEEVVGVVDDQGDIQVIPGVPSLPPLGVLRDFVKLLGAENGVVPLAFGDCHHPALDGAPFFFLGEVCRVGRDDAVHGPERQIEDLGSCAHSRAWPK